MWGHLETPALAHHEHAWEDIIGIRFAMVSLQLQISKHKININIKIYR